MMKQARRRARECALQALYQWLLARTDAADIERSFQEMPGFGRADRSYFNNLLYGVIQDKSSLDAQLACKLDRTTDALSPVEHAILLIGAYELTHHKDIPYRVVINEAVELSKTFGGTDGFKYVNGVLDQLAASVRRSEHPSKHRLDGAHG